LKSIEGHINSEGVIIAAICSVIDNFHFETPDTAENWVKSDAARHTEKDMNQPSKVQMTMEQQVLPLMKRYLFRAGSSKSRSNHLVSMSFEEDQINLKENVCSIRVPMALAVVKVLRRLRAQTFYMELPKLLLSFVKLLRSKEESIRVSARTTLVKISIELGPRYLLPIVEELRHTLRDGYMVHVLSYTLHSVLEKIDTMIEPKKPASLLQGSTCSDDCCSPLDECIPSIMHIIVEDMFSGVIESQDGSDFKSKMKEAKSSRSYDSLELVAKSLTFYPNESIHAVVTPIIRKYQVHESSKSLLVLREGLRRIALGLSKNPSVEPSYGFLYIHSILTVSLERIRPQTHLEKEKYVESSSTVSSWLICDKTGTSSKSGLLEKKVSAYETAQVQIYDRTTGFDSNSEQLNKAGSLVHLEELMNFAVFMAYTLIRSGAVFPELVDPLVPNLLRCAGEVRHDKIVINSIKCLSTFLNHNIPSMEIALASFVDRVFKIIQKAGSSTRNEMVQTCYRALTIVLQRRPSYRLSEPQLRVLLGFLRADLEEMDHQNATYALLKSVVASKVVIPEVYNVMARVGELILHSDTQSARVNCSSIFINFLLDYPLGSKRLSQHLNFLMNNLCYIHESGRKGVLDCLSALVKKLPQSLLNERAQFFFLPLVLRVANDESAECRGLASEVIRTLMGRLGNQELNECVLLLSKWWNPTGTERKLQCIAAQITGLLLELRPEFLEKVAVAILEHALIIIDAQLIFVHDGEGKSIDWMLLYHCINCLVKFSVHLVGPFEEWLDVSGMLERIQRLLQHPHPWVRLVSIQLLSSYLSRRDPTTLKFNKKIKRLNSKLGGDEFLKKEGKLFVLASTICNSIQKQLNDDITKEVLVVLPFLCTALYKNTKIRQNLKNEVDDFAEVEDLSLDKNSALGWVFSRLSYAARDFDENLQVTVYKVFAAVTATHDASMWENYLVHMINPLYRSASTKKEGGDNESAVLAQEVLEFLEKKAGSSVFLEAYTHVQKRLIAFRAARKEKCKQDAINNPEEFAKRKIRKNEQKRMTKQLKKRKYTLMKGTIAIANRPQKIRRPGVEE
jgi:U3 small nucleolar RNA-associated protein 20